MEDEFNLLKNIKKVDAPPFLFTRILSRIENLETDKISPKILWSFVAVLLLLFISNFAIIKTQNNEAKTNFSQTTEMIPNNQLYNE